MTELEMLKRAEIYTMELIHQKDRENEIFKEAHGYDNPITMKLLDSYWNDVFDIWEEIDKIEKINKNK